MITLTRLNGKLFTLNAIYIEQVESFPDTTITLTNGRKFVVRDSIEEVNDRITKYYQQIAIINHRQGEVESIERE